MDYQDKKRSYDQGYFDGSSDAMDFQSPLGPADIGTESYARGYHEGYAVTARRVNREEARRESAECQ